MAGISWVACDGGPHLLVESELAIAWGGTRPPEEGRVVNARFRWSDEPGAVATDYDAACDVDDLVGLVPVGRGVGLVLGDEVPMSTWIPHRDFAGGVVVVPMEWPEPGMPEERLLSAVASVPSNAFSDTDICLAVGAGGLVLCAAADSGPNWTYPTLHVSVLPGRYRVLSAEVETRGFLLRLHGLHNAT
jgi:hypothetical protein